MLEVNEDELYSPEDLEYEGYGTEAMPEVADLDNELWERFRYHEGKPFTGKAIAECAHYTVESHYINGLPHGRAIGVYRNGQQFYEYTYEYGRLVGESFTWNEKGVLVEYGDNRGSLAIKRTFDDDGILSYEYNAHDETEKYFYKSGALRSKYAGKLLEVYAPNGAIAFTRCDNDSKDDAEAYEKDGMHTYRYDDEIMTRYIMELAGEQELRSDIVYWIFDLEERNRNSAIAILNALIGHDNLFIKSEAISIAGDSGYSECLPAIRKELNNRAVPGIQKDHRRLPSFENDTPISETAREAVGAITGAN